MIAMLMLTFLIFFAFVIHTGTLVSAKINLQNAADLAAYAGAATQARQLTQISYLNYEMRRQYKKFLFRYYVMGNMAQGTHPKSPVAGPRQWRPNTSKPDLGAPVVCLIFNTRDNFCLEGNLQALRAPRPSPLDSISQVLFEQYQQLEAIRQNNCRSIGDNNLQVLMLWLFNTDPQLRNLAQAFQDPDVTRNLATLRALTQGIGLVPRQLLLRKRAETLSDYINQPAEEMNVGRVAALQSATDSHAKERSIQAFLSAYNTLGNHTFDADTISMTELLPNTDPASKQLLKLQDVRASFDTYALSFIFERPATAATGSNAQDCKIQLLPVPVKNLPVGVYKDPKVMTYYAVRLKAKAKTMFSPFGEMELKAYAAARPFGSRIGPPLEGSSEGEFVQPTPGPPQTFLGVFAGNSLVRMQPNLPVLQGDRAARGQGWENNLVLGAMYRAFFPQNFDPTNAANFVSIGLEQIARALPVAMAPNPPEGNRYSIPNDLGNDPFIRNFDSSGRLVFWAPIVPPDKVSSLNTYLQESLGQILQDPANSGGAAITSLPYKRVLTEQLIKYATEISEGSGEDGETLNLATMSDPLSTRPVGNLPRAPLVQPVPQPKILALEPAAIKTSWVSEVDRSIAAEKRSGYSVKFVPFETLRQVPTPTTDGTRATNVPQLDEEAESDIDAIRH